MKEFISHYQDQHLLLLPPPIPIPSRREGVSGDHVWVGSDASRLLREPSSRRLQCPSLRLKSVHIGSGAGSCSFTESGKSACKVWRSVCLTKACILGWIFWSIALGCEKNRRNTLLHCKDISIDWKAMQMSALLPCRLPKSIAA